MLTLPTGKTVQVTRQVAGQADELIDITTAIGEVAPQITVPSWIDLYSNTSVPQTTGLQNVQIRVLAKTEPVTVYKDGKYVLNPSGLKPKTMKIQVAQISPVQIADKTEMEEIDIESGYKELLAKDAGVFIDSTKTQIEVAITNNLAYEAYQFNKKLIEKVNLQSGKKSTFAAGYHINEKNIATSEEAFQLLQDLKPLIERTGTKWAKNPVDANDKYTTRISQKNVLILMSHEFFFKLLRYPGLMSSDKGMELFRQLDIREIAGWQIKPTSFLPDGVNFVAFTTGEKGAYVYKTTGPGVRFVLRQSPDWSHHQIMEKEMFYIAGIIHPQYIWASVNENVNLTEQDAFEDATAAVLSQISSRANSSFVEEIKTIADSSLAQSIKTKLFKNKQEPTEEKK